MVTKNVDPKDHFTIFVSTSQGYNTPAFLKRCYSYISNNIQEYKQGKKDQQSTMHDKQRMLRTWKQTRTIY
jgi:hypothetical protein